MFLFLMGENSKYLSAAAYWPLAIIGVILLLWSFAGILFLQFTEIRHNFVYF
jgi:hypothetical protein